MNAGAEIRVNGTALDASLQERLVEVRVQDNLRLPDALLVRIADPGLQNMDAVPLEIGATIEALFAGADDTSATSVFKGVVTSLEPEFAQDGTVIAARAYDGSHLLHQTRRTQTFQNMTADDIARKVARNARIDVGTIESAGPVHDFVQQNNETDWEFLWRLASRIDFEVLVVDRKLTFRKAGANAAAQSITLRWGDELITFRPRVTGVHQVEEVSVRAWDPVAKQAIEAKAKVGRPSSQIGIDRDKIVRDYQGGSVLIVDRPVFTQEEADQLAGSYAALFGNSYLEAEGSCKGNPRLRAGAKIKVDGIGTRFGGTYVASSTTHVFRGGHGYHTLFSTAGRTARSLVDLMTPATQRGWGNSVVIGTVTQNDDPSGLGRVRVSYPALDDSAEGWWARIAAPAAGKDRGLLMMPVVGDEVLIAFEHDDIHKPYVLGALWNGQAKPGDLVQKDGSFVLASDEQVHVSAKDNITISGEKDFSLETDGKISQKADGELTIEGGTSVTVKAGTGLTIEGTTQLTLKCGAAKIDLSAAGTVQISGTSIQLG